jgi:PAS domain S-box-containing protein
MATLSDLEIEQLKRRVAELEQQLARERRERTSETTAAGSISNSAKNGDDRLRIALAAGQLGIFEWDAKTGTGVWENQRMYELFGRSPEDGILSGQQFMAEVLHPDDVLAFRTHLGEAARTGEVFKTTCRIRRRDGEIRWLEFSGRFHVSPNGDAERMIGLISDITERKQTEEALRSREEQFRTLLNALPDIIARFDRNLRFLYLNPAVESLTGLPPEHFLGKTHSEAGISKELTAKLQASLRRIFETGQREAVEFDFVSPSSPDLRHLIGIGVPEIVENGSVVTALSIVRDITERKRSEEAIRQSEARYRTLAESLPQLVWTCMPDGGCDYLSSQWVAYTGLPATDQLGMQWMDVVLHPDDRDRTYRAWMAAVSGQAPYDLEYRLRRHDGVYRWFKTRGTPVRDANGQIVRWFGTCTDIDDQRRAEDERLALLLREQEARAIAELLNQVGPALSSELDAQKLAQQITDIATQATGAEFGALFHNAVAGGTYMLYTLSGAPREAFANFPMPRNTPIFAHTFENKGVLRSDDITKDPRYGNNPPYAGMPEGHLPVRSYLAVPVVSRSGQVFGGLFFGHSRPGMFTQQHERTVAGIAGQAAIAMDNAQLFAQLNQEQQRAELALQALQHANNELRRANSDLEQFAYSASHDLQEPLRMISLFTQMLKRKYKGQLDSQANEYIDQAVHGAVRMEKLVRDLLEYFKLTSTTQESPPPAVDAGHALEEAIVNLRGAIERTGAKITYDALPPVAMHEVHLQQLFQNLVGNAIKYRSHDVPKVHVSATRSDGSWRFSVQDNGIGIDPRYSEQIFGVFKRLHGNHEYEGTGIGLAICHKIVERYGGRIWLESEPGRGSTFFFTILIREVQTGD